MGQIQSQLNQLLLAGFGAAHAIKGELIEPQQKIKDVVAKAQAIEAGGEKVSGKEYQKDIFPALQSVTKEYQQAIEQYGTPAQKRDLYAGKDQGPFNTWHGEIPYGSKGVENYWKYIRKNFDPKEHDQAILEANQKAQSETRAKKQQMKNRRELVSTAKKNEKTEVSQ